jgi:hypothetical protein
MKRIVLLLALLVAGRAAGQEKRAELLHDGWSSLSGVVRSPGAKAVPLEGAVVFLKISPTAYFPIHPDDRKRKGSICLEVGDAKFMPAVFTYFPSYFDGKQQRSTGQLLQLVNGGTNIDNARGNETIRNRGFNSVLPPGKFVEVEMKPDSVPMFIVSDLNPGKEATIWAFDHPYHAVTGKNGKYALPRVPANCEVSVVVWHKEHGWLNQGRKGQSVKLGKQPNLLNVN